MKRNTLNYLLDGALALAMAGLLATGLLMRFVLPPRSGRLQLWGWDRHQWGDLHLWVVIFFLAVLLAHLALHWQWVCVTTSRLFRRRQGAAPMKPLARNLLGTGLLVAVIGLCFGFVHLANSQVTDPRSSDRPQIQSTQHQPGQGAQLRLGRHRNAAPR